MFNTSYLLKAIKGLILGLIFSIFFMSVSALAIEPLCGELLTYHGMFISSGISARPTRIRDGEDTETSRLDAARKQRFEMARINFNIIPNSIADRLLTFSEEEKFVSQDHKDFSQLAEENGGLCGQVNLANFLFAIDEAKNPLVETELITQDIKKHRAGAFGTNAPDMANCLKRKSAQFSVSVSKSASSLEKFFINGNVVKMVGVAMHNESKHWLIVAATNSQTKQAILINPHLPNDIFIADLEDNFGIRFRDPRLSRKNILVIDEVTIEPNR